ncbi:hypothetical protein OROGR_031293 [Orobanche gracilis]
MGGRNQNSSSSSCASQRTNKRLIYCDCGVRSPILTSWTDDNPGRKFFGCGFYEVYGKKCCGFFQWYDDEDFLAAKDKVIARLVKKNEEMNENNEDVKEKNQQMRNKIEDMKKELILMQFLFSGSLVVLILLLIAYVTK